MGIVLLSRMFAWNCSLWGFLLTLILSGCFINASLLFILTPPTQTNHFQDFTSPSRRRQNSTSSWMLHNLSSHKLDALFNIKSKTPSDVNEKRTPSRQTVYDAFVLHWPKWQNQKACGHKARVTGQFVSTIERPILETGTVTPKWVRRIQTQLVLLRKLITRDSMR